MTGDLSRLSLHQASLPAWGVAQAVDACAREGIVDHVLDPVKAPR